MKPRIAITASIGKAGAVDGVHVHLSYVDAVSAGGGLPIILPPLADDAVVEELLGAADGLLLTGGRDLDPALWGEKPHPKTVVMDARRQKADMRLIAEADARGLPVLGICLGIQEMAVARGGRLIQHLPDEKPVTIDHGTTGRPRATHIITVTPDSRLAKIVGAEPLTANSTHHQAVSEPGRNLRIVARASDGIIEGIEDPTPGRFFLGVQWHPEDLIKQPRHLALFEALCKAAARK